MIPYTPEELIEIANKEFAWCEAEMKKASREMGYGDDWKKAHRSRQEKIRRAGQTAGTDQKAAYEAIELRREKRSRHRAETGA